VQEVLAAWGHLDLVIQSAGIAGYGLFTELPAAVFDQIIATNVLGTANVVRSVLPSMRSKNQGTVIMVGSIIGYIATPLMSAYTTSKWAVRGLLRTVQVENRDRPGVHICYLAPAGVDTPIYRLAANYSDREGQPPPPVLTPDEVAAAAFRLADRPRRTAQVGVANPLVITGFNLLPGLYDRLVTPLFRGFASRASGQRHASRGNAFETSAETSRQTLGR
jgi:short-subunit dehydrogenase